SEEEGSAFVSRFARHRASEYNESSDIADRRAIQWLTQVDREIIRRPVHARMLGEIAGTGRLAPSPINHYSLYNFFVDASITRELEKDGRDKRIGARARRLFVTNLAWWSWTEAKKTSFAADEIPESVYDVALKDLNISTEVGRREIIISSLLDRKAISEPKLAFLHRSMQEFLVSDYALQKNLASPLI